MRETKAPFQNGHRKTAKKQYHNPDEKPDRKLISVINTLSLTHFNQRQKEMEAQVSPNQPTAQWNFFFEEAAKWHVGHLCGQYR